MLQQETPHTHSPMLTREALNARLDPIAMQRSSKANLIGANGDRGESEVKFICEEWLQSRTGNGRKTP